MYEHRTTPVIHRVCPPPIGMTIAAETGNIYACLYYPIAVALITFVIGSLFLKETRSVLIWKEIEKS
jgi:hypothetical protein